MTVPRPVRLGVLSTHIIASVGWIGAVAAFIVLDIATVVSHDEALLRAAYIAMDVITDWIIVPAAFTALTTGIGLSLLTKWGLFRHYWVVISLVLTLIATAVLMVQTPIISGRAVLAADPATDLDDLQTLGNLLPHSIGGTAVLLLITVLNVTKPRGLTRYGWRKQQQQHHGE